MYLNKITDKNTIFFLVSSEHTAQQTSQKVRSSFKAADSTGNMGLQLDKGVTKSLTIDQNKFLQHCEFQHTNTTVFLTSLLYNPMQIYTHIMTTFIKCQTAVTIFLLSLNHLYNDIGKECFVRWQTLYIQRWVRILGNVYTWFFAGHLIDCEATASTQLAQFSLSQHKDRKQGKTGDLTWSKAKGSPPH